MLRLPSRRAYPRRFLPQAFDFGRLFGGQYQLGRDLCKKAFPPTAETQTQVFVYFRP